MLRLRESVSFWAWLLTALAALGCSGPAADAQPAATAKPAAKSKDDAAEPAPGEKWVRLLRDKHREPLAMQTAIVRYVPAKDVVEGKRPDSYPMYVDLVGAVHIGDKSYYQDLNRRFRKYDAVLYELVAPEGTQVPLGRGTVAFIDFCNPPCVGECWQNEPLRLFVRRRHTHFPCTAPTTQRHSYSARWRHRRHSLSAHRCLCR